jgi:hypothetical protein
MTALIQCTDPARTALRDGEALVFDWHRVAICCAAAGEVSLRCEPCARVKRSPHFRALSADPATPVYAHRQAYPHLVDRSVTIDLRRRFGMRRFVSDLPPDFGLRACLGRLPEPSPTAADAR